MAVINFPDSPSDGDTQDVGGITYTYSSSKGYWTAAASSGGGGGGGASVTTDDSAPSSPSDGDLWYDTDDGGMFVYYEDTDSSQWVEVIGSQGATGAAGAAGADGGAGIASVYATIDLLPLTGNTQGDMAHVTANNTLYFWNGSGWYKIALINTNPSISGVSSSYALAIDGTATTVTITASDPEGLPITYSIASDTSGNIATVSQGTGASTNVFTITPSTNTAYAGSFTLTFRASDGVNIATAPATFTLQFRVANSNYTSLLLTTDGSTGGNTTFTDSSSNSHTVTANGVNTVQSTFSPYRPGGYSAYFDGTAGTKLTSQAALDFSGAFTIEYWMNTTVGAAANTVDSSFGDQLYVQLFTDGTGEAKFHIRTGSTTFTRITGTTQLHDGEWHHLAAVRDSSGTMTLYVDGVSEGGTATETANIGTNQAMTIGAFDYQATAYDTWRTGYVRDFRVSSNARYSSNFTAPTEPLTADSNTSLLTCHLPYFADGSTNSHTITPAGNVATIPFSPYDDEEYAVGDHGGSVYFYGTAGNNLDITPSAANLGTGDFTVECWTYWSADPRSIIYDTRQSDGNSGHAIFMTSTTHNVVFYDNNATVLTSAGAVKQGIWNHIAVVRNSGTINIFINGKKDTAQVTGNTTNFDAHTFRIGEKTYGGIPNVTGNITDFRISSTARYTTDFTPATAPLASDGNTSLLLNMQGATILDKAQANARAILVGNTTASTTQYKYLPSSIYFDGADDGIRIPMASGVGATARLPGSFAANEDFTIEMWHYLTARTELYPCLFSNYGTTGSSTLGLFAGHNSYTTTQYQVRVDSNGNAIDAGTINYNQWVHVALVRSSGTITLYIDGTSVGTTSSSAALLGNGNWMGIGFSQSSSTVTSIHGYLSDVRITRGLARYTANFTPPTAALQG